jgi:hypothetical protein
MQGVVQMRAVAQMQAVAHEPPDKMSRAAKIEPSRHGFDVAAAR